MKAKKLLAAAITLTMVFGAAGNVISDSTIFSTDITACALSVDSGECSDNLWWDLESDGKLTISGNGEMTEHPWASHLGYSGVTTYIQTVEVKDGVKSICGSAFNMGFYLKSVSLPDSVTKIGDCAFMDCESLEEINLPDTITEIGKSAFDSCVKLKKVTVPKGVKTLNHGVFDNCDGLTEVVLQSGLTEIKTQSLGELKSVSQITIPKSVTTIEDHGLGYKFTGVPGSEWQKNNDLIILGYEGSAAEKYAKDNGFNFVAITAHDPIDSVGITVTPPKPGQSPDTKAECDTDLAEFWGFSFDDNNNPVPTKGCICWFDGSRLMTPKDKFEGGKAYSAYITQLTPKEGYYFPFEAKITINGKRMNRDDDSEALSAQFICPKNIDSINLTVTEPKAGKKPSFEFKNSTEGVDISAEVEWYDDDTKLNKLNTFEAGNTYTVRIVVKREDFKVDEAYTIDGSTKYLINGKETEREVIEGGIAFTAEFTAKKAEDSSSAPDSSSKPDDSSSKPDKPEGKLGDVNGDGTIDIEDAVMVINHINGITPLKDDEEQRAEVSKDKNIDIDDAVMIVNYINGISTF